MLGTLYSVKVAHLNKSCAHKSLHWDRYLSFTSFWKYEESLLHICFPSSSGPALSIFPCKLELNRNDEDNLAVCLSCKDQHVDACDNLIQKFCLPSTCNTQVMTFFFPRLTPWWCTSCEDSWKSLFAVTWTYFIESSAITKSPPLMVYSKIKSRDMNQYIKNEQVERRALFPFQNDFKALSNVLSIILSNFLIIRKANFLKKCWLNCGG